MLTEKETWREYEDELYYDAVSGEPMVKDLVNAARKVEMETFKKHGVYEKRPMKECVLGEDGQSTDWSQAGRHEQRRHGEPRAEMQVGRQGDKAGRKRRSVRGHAAARIQEDFVLVVGQHGRDVSGLHRCHEGLLLCKSEERSVCGVVKGGQ